MPPRLPRASQAGGRGGRWRRVLGAVEALAAAGMELPAAPGPERLFDSHR